MGDWTLIWGTEISGFINIFCVFEDEQKSCGFGTTSVSNWSQLSFLGELALFKKSTPMWKDI